MISQFPALVTRSFDNVVCGSHLTHIKPKKIFGDYLFRCFQSKWLQSYFEISANGITRYGISVDKFNSALILIPTEKEQKIIASFLDKETFLIDALIQKKEQKIKLLKEKRSALITQAVTKGVNPNIKMKDSCIEYLGKIPEYWEIKKLRYVGQCQNGISKKAEYFGTGLPFLGYSEVYNFFITTIHSGCAHRIYRTRKKTLFSNGR